MGGIGVLVTRLERMRALDPVSDRLRDLVLTVQSNQRLRDALRGVWLGHPLHPALVHAPIGAWLSAALLDAMAGQEKAATTLVAAGTAAALPSATTGAADWSALSREQQRVGLVHAGANLAAVGLYGASLAARLRGNHRAGRRLGYVGLGVAGAGAYLGGHLSFTQAALRGPDRPTSATPTASQTAASTSSRPSG